MAVWKQICITDHFLLTNIKAFHFYFIFSLIKEKENSY